MNQEISKDGSILVKIYSGTLSSFFLGVLEGL